ncbi:MAG: hypothetical protein AB1521_06800 [Bacteroidota bacterium]
MKREHYQELGLYIVSFQTLEQAIALIANELISDDQTLGNILISKMSFRNLCEIFSALFNYRCNNVNLNKKLLEILKRIKTIEEKRNTFIHSIWGFPATHLGNGALRIKKRIKKNVFSFDLDIVKKEDIRKATQEISKVIDDFFKLIQKSQETNCIKFSKFVHI